MDSHSRQLLSTRVLCDVCILVLSWIAASTANPVLPSDATPTLSNGQSAQHERRQPKGLANSNNPPNVPVAACGTVNKAYEHFPLGLSMISDSEWETKQIQEGCPCNEDTLYNVPRMHTLTNGTAQVNHQAPPFQTGRVHAHRQGDQVVGCEWQWECRHSLNRFPQIYEEAELVSRPFANDRCGAGGKGTCRATLSLEMVLRHMKKEKADESGQHPTFWGIHMEYRKVGWVCVMDLPKSTSTPSDSN